MPELDPDVDSGWVGQPPLEEPAAEELSDGLIPGQVLEAALTERLRPGKTPEVTGDIEAHLVTLPCSDPPEGAARWTRRLLADRTVEAGYLDSLSHVTVRERLENWQVKSWCLSKPSARFVAKMEDVPAVYQRPHDPKRRVVRLVMGRRQVYDGTAHSLFRPVRFLAWFVQYTTMTGAATSAIHLL